ncbi:hypothetical protein FHG87_001269 [Trinorchestia longiramus]|nr:hypothetical protein FHG87_001269 [Trinorchestia longiramus]
MFQLIRTADEAATFLQESVVQCEQVEEDRYRVVVRQELLFDEVPYREMPDEYIKRTSGGQRCNESTKDK